MTWQKIIPQSELAPGAKKVIQVGDRKVLLIHSCGKIFATATNCPHWGLPLEGGRLTDDCGLVCPWHRSAFDLPTGDVKAWAPWPPGIAPIIGATSRRKVLTTFPTHILDDDIWVTLDPAEAATPPTNGKPAPAAAEPAPEKAAPTAPEPATSTSTDKPAPPATEPAPTLSVEKTAPTTPEPAASPSTDKPAPPVSDAANPLSTEKPASA